MTRCGRLLANRCRKTAGTGTRPDGQKLSRCHDRRGIRGTQTTGRAWRSPHAAEGGSRRPLKREDTRSRQRTSCRSMGELSWNAIKQIVYERANGCCEYCQTCEANSGQTMQVDHIDPRGDDRLENLCLSCWNCNSSKRDYSPA